MTELSIIVLIFNNLSKQISNLFSDIKIFFFKIYLKNFY